jgi:hypothetical protein
MAEATFEGKRVKARFSHAGHRLVRAGTLWPRSTSQERTNSNTAYTASRNVRSPKGVAPIDHVGLPGGTRLPAGAL